MDIIVGTFSKSLASIGGFAVGSEAMEVLRYGSRPYILPPLFSVLHCDRALVVKNHCLTTRAAAKLMDNANHLYDGLQNWVTS